jgi:hypothetical protein
LNRWHNDAILDKSLLGSTSQGNDAVLTQPLQIALPLPPASDIHPASHCHSRRACPRGTVAKAQRAGVRQRLCRRAQRDDRGGLTQLSTEVDQKAKAQIAVVTIKTLEGDTVEDFANHLFKKWGVGAKGTDRGVMVLLATDDHKYWTEVGYGLEPILPDGKVGGFGRDMVPLLRQGDYNGAVAANGEPDRAR